MKGVLIIFVFVLFLSACTRDTDLLGLQNEIMRAQGDTLGKAMYLGHKDGYSYFQIYYNVGSRKFKVPGYYHCGFDAFEYGSEEPRMILSIMYPINPTTWNSELGASDGQPNKVIQQGPPDGDP